MTVSLIRPVPAGEFPIYVHPDRREPRPTCPYCEFIIADGSRTKVLQGIEGPDGLPRLAHAGCYFERRRIARAV